MIRFPSLAAVLALALPGLAAAQPPVWVVRDHDSELVLFGSVHVLPEGLDWRPAALTRALKGADDLWFELPIDQASQTEAAQLAVRRGLLPAGESLSTLLGPDDAARLAKVASGVGLSPAQLDRMQPWFCEVALAAAAYQASGGRADQGVEQQLSASAPATAQRRAFETASEQINLFADTAREAQLASLRSTLMEMETTPGAYRELVEAWLSGDIDHLDDEALKPLREASPVLYDRLVTQRNAAWIERLKARLAGSGRTVVVVGVGHLIGADGLPERLRELGYSVEGPKPAGSH